MDLKGVWLEDSNTSQPSVSLTLLMVSFVGALVAIGLNLAKVSSDTSSAMQLFYACAGLYFGRRNVSIGNKGVSYSNTSENDSSVTGGN